MQILIIILCLKCTQIAEIYASLWEIGAMNMMVTSDFSPEVEIWPFHARAMHPTIIIRTGRSLWTLLWGRYHVPQNAFLVFEIKKSLLMMIALK